MNIVGDYANIATEDLQDRETFNMNDSSCVTTPVYQNVKLTKGKKKTTQTEKARTYEELIGLLKYLAVATQPDI